MRPRCEIVDERVAAHGTQPRERAMICPRAMCPSARASPKALQNDIEHGTAAEERIAPRARQHRFHPTQILDVDGLIQSERDTEALDVLGGDRGVQRVDRQRSARSQMHDPEADDRNSDHQGDRMQDSPHYIAE